MRKLGIDRSAVEPPGGMGGGGGLREGGGGGREWGAWIEDTEGAVHVFLVKT